MKKIALFFVLFVCLLNLNAKDKEWLPKGESISVYEYIPNNPRSPAAFSSVDSKKLNANQRKGQQVYSKWCIACHGEGMPALLEDRTDLSPDLVTIFVRYGKHSMPFFRKTEISNKELQYLGEYLGRNYK
ncbi:TPA: c-type cytochrome [Campylobacter coli]|uniref:c-type cytochrome n=1 Tax=Campylobacter coli TaxID=195 RepID=UPI00130CFD9C|nr:cytochrome c [Campylobacter coli]EAI7874294.1 cytochrome c [Campylobacter coli]ECR9812829.1 cytochrome c [Campylobacter coli]NUJ13265.1 Cytochrome c6 [Campylobacter coli]HEC1702673.1 cytochrome c [Campylobacter coli]HEC1740158.1 cytochrome c [Campylobacter coli]